MCVTRHAVLVGALWAVFIGGCSVHAPQPTPLPAPLPPSYVEATVTGDASMSFTEPWWKAFGDPLLDALMAEGFAANPDLRQARARLQQAAAVMRTARAAQLPTLDLSAEGGRLRQNTGVFGPVTSDTYTLSLPASFELDLWRRLASRTEAAGLDRDAARLDLKAACLSLSASIADVYFLALEQQSQLALTDRTIAAFADTLGRVERRYREGLVPALDVYQSRQNLAAARARRPQFENGLAAAEHTLAVLLGRYPERGIVAKGQSLPGSVPNFATGVPSQLLINRPDVEASLLRLRASDARIAAAVADRFPALRLTGSYGGQGARPGDLFGSGNIFWNLLLGIVQPLYDGGRRAAEEQRTRAVFREQLASYHQAVLSAFRDVEDALVAGRSAESRIQHLRENETASAAALRLALDRYLLGLSEYLPVLTAQVAHAGAQSDLLEARRQHIAARISLARALGGSWMGPVVTQDPAVPIPKGP